MNYCIHAPTITKQLQDRLFNLCQAYYNDEKTLIQTLKALDTASDGSDSDM